MMEIMGLAAGETPAGQPAGPWRYQETAPRLLPGAGQEHHVAAGATAGDRQLLSVSRPGEVEDAVALEVGSLFGRRAVKRLHPQVSHAMIVQCGVSYALAVRSKSQL
jgi:hypothetical protein